MNSGDLVLDALFTTNGKDVWKLTSFCMEPTCILENLETKKVEEFGMSGLTAESFHRITMPECVSKK